MKAVVFEEFGDPDVLRVAELPDPEPGPGEVLVKVAASTVNPTDIMMRDGRQAALMTDLAPPYVPGMEFSGTVVDANASTLRQGQAVIGVVNPRRPAGGACAELLAVDARSLAPVSNDVDLAAAATVPMNALTASMALDLLELREGDTLLVTGGAGMLGGYAIQLAKERGLRVVANAADADRPLVSSFGADEILPRDAGLEDALGSAYPQGVDGLLDGALIGQRLARFVRDGGAAVSLRKSHPIADDRLRVSYVSVVAGMQDTETLARIARLIEDGVLTPRVAPGGRFSFEQARDAHRMAEDGGFRGRVIMTFDR